MKLLVRNDTCIDLVTLQLLHKETVSLPHKKGEEATVHLPEPAAVKEEGVKKEKVVVGAKESTLVQLNTRLKTLGPYNTYSYAQFRNLD